MRQKPLVIAVLLLTGCSGRPSDAEIQTDITRLFPGCTLESAIAAENSGFDVWMDVSFKCPDGSKDNSLLYRKEGGRWKVISHP